MRTFRFIIGILLICSSIACTRQMRTESQVPPRQTDPSFYKWTSKDLINAFKEYGLEVDDIKSGFIVGVHRTSENTIFMITSLGKEIGAVVSSFDSEKALKQYEEHYAEMNRENRPPIWWIFRKANIVLLISGKVPQQTARQYENVLKQMGSDL